MRELISWVEVDVASVGSSFFCSAKERRTSLEALFAIVISLNVQWVRKSISNMVEI